MSKRQHNKHIQMGVVTEARPVPPPAVKATKENGRYRPKGYLTEDARREIAFMPGRVSDIAKRFSTSETKVKKLRAELRAGELVIDGVLLPAQTLDYGVPREKKAVGYVKKERVDGHNAYYGKSRPSNAYRREIAEAEGTLAEVAARFDVSTVSVRTYRKMLANGKL